MAGPGQVKAGRAYVELGVDDKMAAGLAAAQRRLKAFGQQVQAVGMGMMKLGALIAMPLAIGVKAYANFEQQMANVATMLDEPALHMERFKAGIRSMAVEFGESTEALAGGLYDILSASIHPAKALDVLSAAVKAAKAGMTDTKTAADAITTILNSYGLSAEKAGDVSDWLFAVVKRGKTTFAELAPSIGLVASTASTAGVSLEELGAMTALLTRSGIRTENAITAINSTISNFLKPTDDAAEYARSLGFELSTATIQAEGLAGVFRRIAKLPPEAIAKLFPNIRAIRGVLPALAHLDEFAADMEQMTGRAGRTEQAYQKMAGTLMHEFSRIKQAAVVAFGEIGEALAGSIENATKKILEAIAAMTKWIKTHRQLIILTAKLAAGLIVFGAAAWAAGAAAKAFAVAIGILKVAVVIATDPLKLLTVAALALGAAFLWTSKAGQTMRKMTGEDLALMANNWRIVLEFLHAAVKYQGVRICEEMRHFVCEVIPSYFRWFVNVAGDILRGLWEQIKLDLAVLGENISNFFRAIREVMQGRGWRFEWTPFESVTTVMRELPETADRQISEIEKYMRDRMEQIGKEMEDAFVISLENPLEDQTDDFETALDRVMTAAKSAMEDFDDIELPGAGRPGRAAPAARGTFNPLAVQSLLFRESRPMERVADGVDKLNNIQLRALRILEEGETFE